jgi:maleylacetate reductase
MTASGRVNFSRMDSVIYGQPAAEAVANEVRKLGAKRVFLMVSSTLNKHTDEIELVRRELGNLCCGTFQAMAPHTPRNDVIAATRAAQVA